MQSLPKVKRVLLDLNLTFPQESVSNLKKQDMALKTKHGFP
jgi:hypothetical protein